MRWKNNSSRIVAEDLIGMYWIHAMDIIYDAYHEKFINWNVYNKAMEKIKTNMNGTWMFKL